MGYDLFKDLQKKYGIPCPQVYSSLFKNVKFMPGTIESTITEENTNSSDVVSIYARDVAFFGDMVKVNILTEKTFFANHVVDKIYYVLNYNYFVISNIHVIESGVVFDYECYDSDAFKEVSHEHNDGNPKPEMFAEANIKPFYKDTGFIGYKEKNHAINYILVKFFEAKAKNIMDTSRDRT